MLKKAEGSEKLVHSELSLPAAQLTLSQTFSQSNSLSSYQTKLKFSLTCETQLWQAEGSTQLSLRVSALSGAAPYR